jgi:hypothetical protein
MVTYDEVKGAGFVPSVATGRTVTINMILIIIIMLLEAAFDAFGGFLLSCSSSIARFEKLVCGFTTR